MYKKTIEIYKIDTNDPFNFSKIDGENFRENPTTLLDNICTLSMFSNRRNILLDLRFISITKIIENIILEALDKLNKSNLLIIKGGSLRQSSFIKFFQKIDNAILVPCYEETSGNIYSEICNFVFKT